MSGGIGRAIWVDVFASQLPAWAGISSNFGREVGGVPLASGEGAFGSVGGSLRLSSGYRVGGRLQGPVSAATARVERTGRQFTEVACAAPADQPRVAKEQGVSHALGLPLSGVASAQAQAGWRHLVDVWNPMASLTTPVAQEARSMPQEVAAWLLARRREVHELSARHRHIPKSDTGAPIGEASVRTGGVEKATGTAAAHWLRGEDNPDTDPVVQRERDRIVKLRREAGVVPGKAKDPVDELLRRFRTYFDAYFKQPMSAEQRVGTVLADSNADWGTGAEVLATLSIEGLTEIAMEVGKQALIPGTLSALGPVGEVLSAGYNAYLQTQGVNEVASIVPLAQFFRSAAQVDSFQRARGLGWMAKAMEGDLTGLIQAAVAHGLMKGMTALASRPPRTRVIAAAMPPSWPRLPRRGRRCSMPSTASSRPWIRRTRTVAGSSRCAMRSPVPTAPTRTPRAR